ncbi:related to FUN34-transmembrane protein involved in ammonia production [Armillaria ostoyae]|uniref:Related to FUN34-transmembrane protein involved in ammonia production n=1 Tax=Armillaria ostoyae TaxID=47428 RepID=A0A284SBW8_ARMOS|nr:related to FUN34-transmembrane protein involved in ammonia production [Armillaria ostoyae]
MPDIENSSSSSSNVASQTNPPPDNSVMPCPTRIANPCTLGLFSFASTMLILSTYNIRTGGLSSPNVIVGMAVFYGGLTQLLAGMWEFPRGNTFGGTIFSSYGAFWMSYSAIYIPNFGVLDAYGDQFDAELSSALAVYLFSWMIVSIHFLITSVRKSISFTVFFICLSLTYMFLAWSKLLSDSSDNIDMSWILAKIGGGFGVLAASIAYYIGLSELLASEIKAVPLPTLERLFEAVSNILSSFLPGSS